MKCPCTGNHDVEDCPKYEWIDIRSWADPGPIYVRGSCHHDSIADVRNIVTDEIVRYICQDCNMEWSPPEIWIGHPNV